MAPQSAERRHPDPQCTTRCDESPPEAAGEAPTSTTRGRCSGILTHHRSGQAAATPEPRPTDPQQPPSRTKPLEARSGRTWQPARPPSLSHTTAQSLHLRTPDTPPPQTRATADAQAATNRCSTVLDRGGQIAAARCQPRPPPTAATPRGLCPPAAARA